jgi:hypothetical protein
MHSFGVWHAALRMGLGIALGIVTFTPVHAAGDSWLDQKPAGTWNVIGAAVPDAPPPSYPSNITANYIQGARPPETPEDQAVVAAGWNLVGGFKGGWGMRLVAATSDYDGMGRPWGYQEFVFVGGVFAGTLSPDPMYSRSDGALISEFILAGDRVEATFNRYAPSDTACCPSSQTSVIYSVSRSDDGPLVAPVEIDQFHN